MNIQKISVVIPAYKPDEKLIYTVNGIIEAGFSDIIVVDDGSGAPHETVFEKVKAFKECTLLRHKVNRGKGAALKTAFTYFADNRKDMLGVVTADADGQHLPEDIKAVSVAMLERGDIILGVRDFSSPDVPARSKSGNRITSVVFRLFFGMRISDTQTGLRAIPTEYLSDIALAKGDRYEFETNMLFLINKRGIPMSEVQISTVYIEENKSSHFRVVRDSIRIYSLILKYLFSSCAASAVDIVTYFVLHNWAVFAFIPISLEYSAGIGARIVSSLVNYLLNSKVVFGDKLSKKTLLRYYTLAVGVILVSSGLVKLFKVLLGLESSILITLIKVIVDTVLFFVTFRIQHKWVFNSNGKKVKKSK